MYDRILLPTDGSDGAADALTHAIEEANAHDAELHVLSVADERVFLAAKADEKAEISAELNAEANDAVEALAARAAEADVDVTTAVREGVPYRQILQYAEDEGIDLLVLGTHGRTGRERRINLGSTTERVVKAANQPVLVVNIE